MKTKRIFILAALLLSGVLLSAQAFSDDNGKTMVRHNQTSKLHIETSEYPLGGPITTSFGSWWQLLKLYIVPNMVSNKAIDTEHWTLVRDRRLKGKDRRVLPPLPGPNRHRATKSNSINSNY